MPNSPQPVTFHEIVAGQFTCLRSDTAHVVRVEVVGELDMATVPELDRTLRGAEADAALVVLDVRDLDFIDSSGLHALLAADRRIRRQGGRLVVGRGRPEVEWLLALLGIDRQLELVETASLGRRAGGYGTGARLRRPSVGDRDAARG